MSLMYPYILILLFPVTVMFVYILKYKQIQTIKKSKKILYFLFIASLMIIIASSRPVIKKDKQTIVEQTHTLLIALDVSKSMYAQDIKPNRYKFAVSTVETILNKAPDFKLGLIAFSDNSYNISPPTKDFVSFKMLLNSINIENISNGTNLLNLLSESSIFFDKNIDINNLLIISDGSDQSDFKNEINFAIGNKIKIFNINIASAQLTAISYKNGYIKDKNNKTVFITKNNNFKQLALSTGGISLEYPFSNDQVKQLLNHIRQTSIKNKNRTKTQQYDELFYYPLLIAFFILYIVFFNIPSFKNFKILVLLPILFYPTVQKASIFDFIYLENALNAFNKGDYQIAIDNYNKTDNTDEVLFNIATSYYKLGNYNQSQKIYNKIKTKNEHLIFKKYYNMGNCAFKQKNYYQAKQYFTIATKLIKDIDAIENLERVSTLVDSDKFKYKVSKNSNSKKIYVCDIEDDENNKQQEQTKTNSKVKLEKSNEKTNHKVPVQTVPKEKVIQLQQPKQDDKKRNNEIAW